MLDIDDKHLVHVVRLVNKFKRNGLDFSRFPRDLLKPLPNTKSWASFSCGPCAALPPRDMMHAASASLPACG